MNNIIIRQINDFDWKLISRIEKLEKRNLGNKASINRWVIPVIIRYGKFIVAQKGKNDSDIIGVCELIRDCDFKNRIFIFSFYIDRDYRKKGIGRKLLGKVIDILKDEGFAEVELTVDPDNESAVVLYKNFGFKKVALREDEYGRGKNRDLMRLKLR
jgi:ribosomal protein S18 acetylase RimI-like enzyme